MLRIIRNWELQDYLRNSQGDRNFGMPVNPTHRLQQIGGAYHDANETIVYFIARQIDFLNNVVYNYDLSTSLLKYEDGQYVIDNSITLGGLLPEGHYYLEFNNGVQTYYTEMFTVLEFDELDLASSEFVISDEDLISSLNIDKTNLIILRQFSTEEYVQIAV